MWEAISNARKQINISISFFLLLTDDDGERRERQE
jgi:hypothetical protein